MNKALFTAKACAKAWKIIDSSPTLTKLEKNVSGMLWKSKLLIHPYVQLDRGFVYIHVPKTAGTSLNKALGLKAKLTTSLHNRARDVMPFMKIIAPEVRAITFVRNPYSRFVSLYRFAIADESLYHSARNPEKAPYGKHPDHDLLSNKNLEECAELLIQGKLGDPRDNTPLWRPQVDWLVDKYGKLMVDFIGKMESLDSDLLKLQELYGITSEPVSWLNRSNPGKKTPEFTARTEELVRMYYKRDFEMLGYNEDRAACQQIQSAD